MSPALQGNLEVERYIGSYLISQRVPANVKTSTTTKRYQNQQQHQKPKNPETEKVHRNFNKYCFPQREHHVGGPPRYSMPPMPVDCQAYPNHYGKHSPGNSGWAGVPLISMTSGNHRRNKKVPPTTNHNHPQKYPNNKQGQQNFYGKNKDTEENCPTECDRSPLTRLAIHTQGAPLIQAGRFGNNNRCRGNHTTRVFRNEGVRWDAAKDTKTQVAVVHNNKEQTCGSSGSADNSSVASDESSGNSENSLPRIIKPRKRRKKDRKPITSTTSLTPSSQNEPTQYTRESDQNVESPALQAYLPLCYEQNKPNSSENKTSDLLSDISHITPTEDKQSEDLIDPLTSADEFPFGNLLDDEEDSHSHGECAPATMCQCRYCDPSGVIWDVDQRCYSPFLTPPSPTDPQLHFSNSLTFDSFGHIGSPYNRPEQPMTPPSQYSFSGDLVSLLRRSWSDPSPYKKPESIQSPNLERPLSPGLQVSSEIVTSPNGHRDIEIKFYSSSSPPDSSKVKFGASDREQINSDRCFVVEE